MKRFNELFALSLLAGLLAGGCSTLSEPYERREREYDPGPYPEAPTGAAGSLYAGGGVGFLEDVRPRQIGDVLVIRVDEADSASHDTSTRLDHETSRSYGITGALERLAPEVPLANLFGAKADYDFAGGGRVQRRGQLSAMLPVRVKRVLPNGDLYVEGTKVVRVGEEERQLYISGVVRPVDVAFDGSILSTRLADAELAYTGRGDASDQQRQGFLSKFLSYLWPF
jgi:flagellar L-ring protein FlgH